jgi:DNA polymerase-1
MLVRDGDLSRVLKELNQHKSRYSLDTETYGLHWSSRLFSIIIHGEIGTYYFNFNSINEGNFLPRERLAEFKPLFENESIHWCLHNAKFDMHKLAQDDLYLSGGITCLWSKARIQKNSHMSYTLKLCLKRAKLAIQKDDGVEEYISKNKCYSWETRPGKKTRAKNKHFDAVPLDIMLPYGEIDAKGTYALNEYLQKKIEREQRPIVKNERDLIKTCFAMEEVGITIDPEYIVEAAANEYTLYLESKDKFLEYTGLEYDGSRKVLVEVFAKLDIPVKLSKKGNPCFDKDAMDDLDHPVGQIIREIRRHEKYYGTYYQSFLHEHRENVIKPNFMPAGTDTGRFSCSNPNLQNVPKEEKVLDYYVRKAFVPRPDHCFVMIDYDQMEYRLFMDYAKEHGIINQINAGVDVHQATADSMGVERSAAKTLNFMLLYGGGTGKLAIALGVTFDKAKALKEKYFSKFQNVYKLINKIMVTARTRGYVKNWYGRRAYLTNREFAYKMPNYLIQGGCADVVKIAMNRCDDFLLDKKSNMLLTVHDELVFEVHKSELDIVPKLKEIMENVYESANGIKLTCGVDHSYTSWGFPDKIKGMP